ncbi:B12-binding domain-containing radical SAM protein [bacterium]|nr:B12-binding domain-containing radical SAM protein [bacterium]
MIRAIRKILLINPPGPLYQRGEDRSQGNIADSSATSLRAPNDLAYMAAMLRRIGVTPLIKDYPAENWSWETYSADLKSFDPDAVVMSITNATILNDLQAFKLAKESNPDIVTIAKGALFFACNLDQFQRNEFNDMDVALVGEAETVINDVIEAMRQSTPFETLNGVIYRNVAGKWTRTEPQPFVDDLDALPFPARDLLHNDLYVRPDTGEPQATIQTARGCPSHCIFCLTPAVSGQRVRQRSAKNVVDEIEECVKVHGIRNFFFKADTFTINKKYVIDICSEILERNLAISWVANSRVDTVDEERIDWMKKAGCWLIAFGFESGNDTILQKMKKDAIAQDAYRAVRLVKNAGLRVYGFFLIGLPWDTHETVRDTLKFAKKLNCDFSEIHIATPYEGTELHTIADAMGLIQQDVIGHNYFSDPVMGTMSLTREEILQYRRKGIRSLYWTPQYIFKTASKIRTSAELKNYASYGWRMVKNMLIH